MSFPKRTPSSAEANIRNGARAHTVYKLQNGTRVPGVTTILGVLSKPALVPWANRMGLQGIDTTKYVDALAAVGTAAHAACIADLRGEDVDAVFKPLGADTRTLAENCYLSFCSWLKNHIVEPIALELPLVSEKYGYGGTLDILARVDGRIEIVDLKTGKAIYPDYFRQVAGYWNLVIENGIVSDPIDQFRILNIPRAETEAFDEKIKASLRTQWDIFVRCLDVYKLMKLEGAE
ncbi:MAG: hypothetical protein IMZ57_11050 [Acidobacteria bacterium]|nr:hypothetical protein [Acidobacteriota bacterium]